MGFCYRIVHSHKILMICALVTRFQWATFNNTRYHSFVSQEAKNEYESGLLRRAITHTTQMHTLLIVFHSNGFLGVWLFFLRSAPRSISSFHALGFTFKVLFHVRRVRGMSRYHKKAKCKAESMYFGTSGDWQRVHSTKLWRVQRWNTCLQQSMRG